MYTFTQKINPPESERERLFDIFMILRKYKHIDDSIILTSNEITIVSMDKNRFFYLEKTLTFLFLVGRDNITREEVNRLYGV